MAENSVSILFVGDRFPVPLHSSLFTASPNPFGRFSRLLREAKRLPYSPANSKLYLYKTQKMSGSAFFRTLFYEIAVVTLPFPEIFQGQILAPLRVQSFSKVRKVLPPEPHPAVSQSHSLYIPEEKAGRAVLFDSFSRPRSHLVLTQRLTSTPSKSTSSISFP